jgi:hypothetical protein
MTEKVCPMCGKSFTQAKAPKAEQVHCSYWCHLEALNGGLAIYPKGIA